MDGNHLSRLDDPLIIICTAVLRICIGAQVLLVCLCLASLALEYDQIPEDNIGMMSIYQYANAGPLDIAVPYILRAKMGKNPLGLLVVMLLALAGILTQFA
jgi:hypothetical protein